MIKYSAWHRVYLFLLCLFVSLKGHTQTPSAVESKDNRSIAAFHSSPNNCVKCHLNAKSTQLVLLTGDQILANQVPELCGQCHGIIKRNWNNGTHGKKINFWTNSGEKLICTKCHFYHNPRFPKFKAVSPPKMPKYAIPKGHENE